MWNLVGYFIRRFVNAFSLISLCVAVALGTVLGLLVLAVAPEMPSWSRYKLVLVSLMGLVYFGILVAGDVRRVLLACLVLTIPLNFAFGRVPYHAGGARPGMIIYPYDFPLIGLMILELLDTLGRRKPIQFSDIDMAAILLITWTALSMYNSSHIRLSVFEILRVAKLYLLSRVVASNVKRKRDIQDVLLALLVGLMLQGVITVLQYAGGIDFGLGLFTVGELRRVSGTVGWPNTFGAYAATVLSVSLALWICDAGGRLRIPIWATCMAGLGALLLSFSRGAWASLLAGVAISFFLGWRTGWFSTRSLAKLTVVVLSAITVSALFATSIAARLRAQTFADRIKLNQVAFNMIGAHPLLGVGINTFVNVMRRYDTTGVSSYFPQPVHNVFLLVAAETGLVGLGLFLLLILIALREGLQAMKTNDRFLSASAIAILSGLVVLMVSNLADVHLRTDTLYALFWLLIGLVVAIRAMKISAYPSAGYDRNAVVRS